MAHDVSARTDGDPQELDAVVHVSTVAPTDPSTQGPSTQVLVRPL
jgi:hypothetical protein